MSHTTPLLFNNINSVFYFHLFSSLWTRLGLAHFDLQRNCKRDVGWACHFTTNLTLGRSSTCAESSNLYNKKTISSHLNIWRTVKSPRQGSSLRRVGFIARRLRRPEKGNADGVRGIFGTAWRVWAPALATVRLVRTALAWQSHSYRQRYARTAIWHDKAIATVNDTPAQLGTRQSPSFTDPLARLRMC